jgi:hypothetical protein
MNFMLKYAFYCITQFALTPFSSSSSSSVDSTSSSSSSSSSSGGGRGASADNNNNTPSLDLSLLAFCYSAGIHTKIKACSNYEILK